MSKTKKKTVTPLMQQYNSIKAKYPDALLLFRVGDFYETFGQDAINPAAPAPITMTSHSFSISFFENGGLNIKPAHLKKALRLLVK